MDSGGGVSAWKTRQLETAFETAFARHVEDATNNEHVCAGSSWIRGVGGGWREPKSTGDRHDPLGANHRRREGYRLAINERVANQDTWMNAAAGD